MFEVEAKSWAEIFPACLISMSLFFWISLQHCESLLLLAWWSELTSQEFRYSMWSLDFCWLDSSMHSSWEFTRYWSNAVRYNESRYLSKFMTSNSSVAISFTSSEVGWIHGKSRQISIKLVWIIQRNQIGDTKTMRHKHHVSNSKVFIEPLDWDPLKNQLNCWNCILKPFFRWMMNSGHAVFSPNWFSRKQRIRRNQ